MSLAGIDVIIEPLSKEERRQVLEFAAKMNEQYRIFSWRCFWVSVSIVVITTGAMLCQ